MSQEVLTLLDKKFFQCIELTTLSKYEKRLIALTTKENFPESLKFQSFNSIAFCKIEEEMITIRKIVTVAVQINAVTFGTKGYTFSFSHRYPMLFKHFVINYLLSMVLSVYFFNQVSVVIGPMTNKN